MAPRRGLAYTEQKEFDLAAKDFRRCVTIDPENKPARAELAKYVR